MTKDLEKIMKEGFLEKESRFLKTWRKYLLVLIKTLVCFNTIYSLYLQRKKSL
jgi:hypothetical protein